MQQTCAQCTAPFEITDDDLTFYDRVSPVFASQKQGIPMPKLCPECRLQRRLLFRNDKNFYKRQCNKSRKEMITIYSPDKQFVVYEKNAWWSDDWGAHEYGRDVDFSRPFLEQVQELRLVTPRASLFTNNVENSEYTNHALNTKNSYLIWGGGNVEDCMYGNYVAFCKDVYDGLAIYSSERCYEGVASEGCYECMFFYNSRNCKNCLMIDECTSCDHCIGCYGLHRKSYCLFNEELGKEEWTKRRQELGSLTQESLGLLQQKLQFLRRNLPHRSSHIFASEHCTGDAIYNSRNCKNCFDVKNCEDCKFAAFIPNSRDCYDCTFAAPDGLELSYEANSTLGGQRLCFNFLVYYCSDVYYSFECHFSSKLFGCVGIKHGQHCILNKQYSEAEYEELAAKVCRHMRETGEWGEYFSKSMCPFGYNETVALDYFPLTKEQALHSGYHWNDTLDSRKLDSSQHVSAESDEVHACEVSGKQFWLTAKELDFYHSLQLPMPRRHPIQRHKDRLQARGSRQLWQRQCAQCQQDMQTTYAPDRSEIVYCEECYLKEVY